MVSIARANSRTSHQELERDRQKAEQLADRMSAERQKAFLSRAIMTFHSFKLKALGPGATTCCAQELLSMCTNYWQEVAWAAVGDE